jgi:hypothetical protein
MSGPVTREEFNELADEVRGEKVVTRPKIKEARTIGDDTAALKAQIKRVVREVFAEERGKKG